MTTTTQPRLVRQGEKYKFGERVMSPLDERSPSSSRETFVYESNYPFVLLIKRIQSDDEPLTILEECYDLSKRFGRPWIVYNCPFDNNKTPDFQEHLIFIEEHGGLN